MLSCTYE